MEVNRETIKRLRVARSWSQQHLADACDVSLRTIQRVENMGVAAPETVMALSSTLEADQSALVVDPESRRPYFMPKTDLGVILLIFFTTFIGSVVGSLMTIWLS
ncbi:transcriptional regulator, XRE family [hydrothermal vent metagenome]|uniref:Transcriptional regulator, XRE family n=1 Tax=hydrothermal vent metagenome TaxID=652676 RepID=A0A3B0SI03_9ZZZZ